MGDAKRLEFAALVSELQAAGHTPEQRFALLSQAPLLDQLADCKEEWIAAGGPALLARLATGGWRGPNFSGSEATPEDLAWVEEDGSGRGSPRVLSVRREALRCLAAHAADPVLLRASTAGPGGLLPAVAPMLADLVAPAHLGAGPDPASLPPALATHLLALLVRVLSDASVGVPAGALEEWVRLLALGYRPAPRCAKAGAVCEALCRAVTRLAGADADALERLMEATGGDLWGKVRITAESLLLPPVHGPRLDLLCNSATLAMTAAYEKYCLALVSAAEAEAAPALQEATELRVAGNALFRRGEWAAAASKYSSALLLTPQDPVLLANRSLCWLRQGPAGAQQALEDALRAVTLEPLSAKYWARTGDALRALQHDVCALVCTEAALELSPTNDDIRARHAALLAAVPAARRLSMDDLPDADELADMVRRQGLPRAPGHAEKC